MGRGYLFVTAFSTKFSNLPNISPWVTRFNSVGEPFDPRFHQGRSLKRAMQKELETSLGKLLKGEVGDGRTVVVDADAARGITYPVKSGAESQPQTPGRSA
jgi:hypothetical protein